MPAGGGLEEPLAGVSIGLTAGPTRAWIDPVRYLANASTGQLGAYIADRLASLGADVTAILGPGAALPCDPGIRLIPIETPGDLLAWLERLASREQRDRVECWIHAMAVLDYVPSSTSFEKIPSDRGEWTLALKPTPKIIQHFKPLFPSAKLIGFKLASSTDPEALRQAARQLADSAQCDLVVANPPPFDNPSAHLAWLWEPESSSWTGPAEGKREIADAVANWVCNQLSTGDSSRA